MNKNNISLPIFIALILLYAILAGVSTLLPQTPTGTTLPTQQLPPSPLVVALLGAGITLVLYGALGLIGFFLAGKIGLPNLWDERVSNRQRFLIPAVVGGALGLLIILGDQLFAPVNGTGHFPHPPFPTSIVAAITAGIGEETLFRLFFISFWVWLVSKVILRGRAFTPVYWVVSVFSAVAFGIAHLPSIMFLYGWSTMSQVPPMLIAEMILLNGIIGVAAAFLFKKYGFLAPVGVHLWCDVVWHVVWGAL